VTVNPRHVATTRDQRVPTPSLLPAKPSAIRAIHGSQVSVFIIALALALTVACGWTGRSTPTGTTPKVDTVPFALDRQAGPTNSYYVATIGIAISGNLKAITNRSVNHFQVGLIKPNHSSEECYSNPAATVVLGPGQKTTTTEIQSLTGQIEPPLPVNLGACVQPESGQMQRIVLDVTYSHVSRG
jgi:hypothetical protein